MSTSIPLATGQKATHVLASHQCYMVATVVASAPLCAWDITPPYFWSWVIYNVQFLWKIILPFVDLKSCKMCSLHEMLDLFISLKTDAYRDKSEQSYKVTGYRCTRLPLMCFSFFFYGNKRDCSWSTCVHSVQYYIDTDI